MTTRKKNHPADYFIVPPSGALANGLVFIDIWRPCDAAGKSVGVECALYAAPQDFNRVAGNLTYDATVAEIAAAKKWHGYNGGNFRDRDELVSGLVDGSARGKWFVPPREILDGLNNKNDKVFDRNLFALRDAGAFKMAAHALTTVEARPDNNPAAYWSSTPLDGYPDCLWTTRFSGGARIFNHKNAYRLNCRPCIVTQIREIAPLS